MSLQDQIAFFLIICYMLRRQRQCHFLPSARRNGIYFMAVSGKSIKVK
jgi:hypothetical protein